MSGCAIGADGQLLDASQIQFFNDVDDVAPISGPSNMSTTATQTAAARPIHPLFTGTHSPAHNVAGSRCTAHVSQPSTKACDPDNAEWSWFTEGPVLSKHKAVTATTGRRTLRKVVIDTDV
jgi:hypothetical protein